MPINNHSNRLPREQQVPIVAAPRHTPTPVSNRLNNLTTTLRRTITNLSDRGLLPDNSMPAIRNQHASLFFISPDVDATPAMKRITAYVNTILAAKEHLAKMPDERPAKQPLAALLKKHEAVFTALNDVAVPMAFAREPANIEQAIGATLLANTAREATMAFIADSIESPLISAESAIITALKKEREAAFQISFKEYWQQGQWPPNIMPLSMLSGLSSSAFRDYPEIGDVSNLANLFTLLKLVDHSKGHMGPETQAVAEMSLAMIAKIFEHFGQSLSDFEKKKGLQPESIKKFMCMLLVVIKSGLDKKEGLALRQISYELSRHAPEMILQERNGRSVYDELLSLYDKGSPVKQLALILESQQDECREKFDLLLKFKIAINDFKLDKNLSIAENIANFFLDSHSKLDTLKVVNQFLDGGASASHSPEMSHKSLSKKKRKGRIVMRDPLAIKPHKMSQEDKLNQLFEKIAAFVSREIPQAVPSPEQKHYRGLSQHWVRGTFELVDQSIHYHQLKHAPDDDKISYMAEAREHMLKELRSRPPSRGERYKGVMTRRLPDDAFLRLLRTGTDGTWKIVSFHSPRFTHQGYEVDGKAKLKPGEQPKRFIPQAPEPMSHIEQRLKAAINPAIK